MTPSGTRSSPGTRKTHSLILKRGGMPLERRVERKVSSRSVELDQSAFTFTELLAVLGGLGLLTALAMPALAGTRFRSQQIVCLNNLAQIGRAFALWGTDHGNHHPITVPWWRGGTAKPIQGVETVPPAEASPPTWIASGQYQNSWFQFWWVSNELATPKVLACPGDATTRRASDFSSSINGGFLNPAFRNLAISYALTHSFAEDGRLVEVADRNLPFMLRPGGGGCMYGFTSNAEIPRPFPGWPWDISGDPIHPNSGNLLFTDGSVEQTDNTGLREAMDRFAPEAGTGLGNSTPHFLRPR